MGHKGIIETNPSRLKAVIVIFAVLAATTMFFADDADSSNEIGDSQSVIELDPDLEILIDKNNSLSIFDVTAGP